MRANSLRKQEPEAAARITRVAGEPSSRWRVAVSALALAVAAILVLYWSTVESAAHTWWTSTAFNHGFLIFPISIYLAWSSRKQLAALTPLVSYWGLVVVAAAAFVWLLGRMAGVLIVQQFAFVAMLQGLVILVLGRRIATILAFPIFYLYFAVPFGNFMVAPLQDATAQFVVRGLQMVGVPVYLDGIFIAIPGGLFEVAEACAGVRFLIATVALGFLVAYEFYRSWWRRLAVIALSVIVPIMANGFRAFGIVMIAHLSDFEIAVSVDHIVYGWLFFAFVTVVLLLISWSFRESGRWAATTGAPARIETGGHTAALSAVACVAAVAVAAAAPVFLDVSRSRAETVAEPVLNLPRLGGNWLEIPAQSEAWRPVFAGADSEVLGSFVANGRQVDIFVAFYARQSQGRELVNSNNRFDNPNVWTRVGGGTADATPGGPPMVGYTRLVSRNRGRLVWHWYWVDSRFTSNPLLAKALQVKASFYGQPAAAVIAVATDYVDRIDDAVPVLRAFLEDLGSVRTILNRAADRSVVATSAAPGAAPRR